MADTNVNAPLNRTGTAPKAGPDNRRSAEDDEVDAALEAALGKDLEEPSVSFKRQWDAGLQAELDAALADFDESSFNAPSPRSGKPSRSAKERRRTRSRRPARRPHRQSHRPPRQGDLHRPGRQERGHSARHRL